MKTQKATTTAGVILEFFLILHIKSGANLTGSILNIYLRILSLLSCPLVPFSFARIIKIASQQVGSVLVSLWSVHNTAACVIL